MNRKWAVPLVPLLAMWACSTTPETPTTTVQWEDSVAEEVQTQVESTMGAFAAMDLDLFQAGLAEDVVGFEMDLENKPVRLGSRADVVDWAESTFVNLGEMGATLALDIHSISCRATSTLAFCTVEFDVEATMADGDAMLQPSRNSVVLRKSDDGWRWIHWHSSSAVSPQPSALP